MESVRIFKELYKNFLVDQKKRLLLYSVLSFVCAFSECFGLSMLLPALQLILSPPKVHGILLLQFSNIAHITLADALVAICICSIVLKDLLSIWCNRVICEITTVSASHIVGELVHLERNATYVFLQKYGQSELQTIHHKCLDVQFSVYDSIAQFLLSGILCLEIGCLLLFVLPVATCVFLISAIAIFSIQKTFKSLTPNLTSLYKKKKTCFFPMWFL